MVRRRTAEGKVLLRSWTPLIVCGQFRRPPKEWQFVRQSDRWKHINEEIQKRLTYSVTCFNSLVFGSIIRQLDTLPFDQRKYPNSYWMDLYEFGGSEHCNNSSPAEQFGASLLGIRVLWLYLNHFMENTLLVFVAICQRDSNCQHSTPPHTYLRNAQVFLHKENPFPHFLQSIQESVTMMIA